MTLYSANVLDMAKPVTKGKKKAVAPKAEEPVVAAVEDVKPKRQASEAQIAALKKGQETRKRKREEAMAAKKAEEDAIVAKKAELDAVAKKLAEKKEALREKRRAAKKTLPTPAASDASSDAQQEAVIEKAVEEVAVKEKKRRIVKPKTSVPDVPPAWFAKYVEGVKQEEARVGGEKKSKKVVAQEAKVHAGEAWNDGLTRNRIQTEVDNHQDRMFSMIFAGRRMK